MKFPDANLQVDEKSSSTHLKMQLDVFLSTVFIK